MLRWRFAMAATIIAALIGLCWLDAHSRGRGSELLPALFSSPSRQPPRR